MLFDMIKKFGEIIVIKLHAYFEIKRLLNQTFHKISGNAFKMSSSSWASKRQSRENWAEEVIAAAMKTGSEEGKKSLQVT